MSFYDFPDEIKCKVFETNDVLPVGSFKTLQSGELRHIRVMIFIKNIIQQITNEKIRVKIFSDSSFQNILYTSNWSNLSDIDNLNPLKDWIGWIKCDFNKENINKEITYYSAIEIGNYALVEPFFIAAMYDFPNPVYDNGENFFKDHPLASQIFMDIE